MIEEPLERLQPSESLGIWDRFDAAFDFPPSTEDFPAITEPADSITWSLSSFGPRPDEHRVDSLVALICDALAVHTPPGGSLLILEWQHQSYRLRPHLPPTDMFLPAALMRNLPPGWPRSLYPYGDYPVALTEDFRFGSFGHPWERTLCLFGAGLLEFLADEVTTYLPTIVRRGGRPSARSGFAG